MLDRATGDVYQSQAADWADRRTDTDLTPALRLADAAVGPILDLGCGPGFHLAALPDDAIGVEPVDAMLRLAARRAPAASLIRGEAAGLPFADGSLGGALVSKVYVHLDRPDLPMALAELHRVVADGGPVELVMFGGDTDLVAVAGSDLPGRRFALWREDHLCDVFEGAGFSVERFDVITGAHWPRYEIGVRRRRSLPDTVGPGMRVLVCGLNPSLHAADMGIGFGRPGNRFWPAALAAGVVSIDRDPRHALDAHGVGMTDLVKRATPRADEISRDEFTAGLARVERLCAWLRPDSVCMVGLTGWRQATDRRATAGWQDRDLGGSPVYVMPSTSGLNAHAQLPELTDHLRAAAAGP